MATHPSVTVTTGIGGPPAGSSIDTGTAFLIGEVATGGGGPVHEVRSLQQFADLYGGRDVDSPELYDTLDRAFQQGLVRAFVAPLADQDAAGATASALALFPDSLGCGQVHAVGNRSTADMAAVVAHAAARNRTAVLQLPDLSYDQQVSAAGALRSAVQNAETAFVAGSWIVGPNGSGGTRTTPLAADVLGLMARVDGMYGNSGHAAAGDQGVAAGTIYNASSVTKTLTDSQWDALYDAGVNVATVDPLGTVELSSFSSLSSDAMWQQMTAHRLRMMIAAFGRDILQGFLFRTIDGREHLFTEVREALVNTLLMPLWQADVLFGDTPDEAFTVDTSYGVGRPNNPGTVNAHRLVATGSYVPAPFAEAITFTITAEAVPA